MSEAARSKYDKDVTDAIAEISKHFFCDAYDHECFVNGNGKHETVRNCISQLVQLSARISTDQRDRQSRCLHANSVQWKCSIDKGLRTQQEVEE